MPLPTTEQVQHLARLHQLFCQVPDTRMLGKVVHTMGEVIMVALCSTLCGLDAFTDMELFANNQLAWLRTFIPLINGAPSHDTFRYVFMRIEPAALLSILHSWCEELSGKHICIDGKVMCGTRNAESGKPAVHLVRAWVDEFSLSAGQVACAQKSNEIEAIPRLLSGLQLKGATVTIDAAGCQHAIVKQIHEAEADYIIALKANQSTTMKAVEAIFHNLDAAAEKAAAKSAKAPAKTAKATAKGEAKGEAKGKAKGEAKGETKGEAKGEAKGDEQPAKIVDTYTTIERAHGRYEHRSYTITNDLSAFGKSWTWDGLQSIGRVERLVQRGKEEVTVSEVVYYLCSTKPNAEHFAQHTRGHWSIENKCHWVLDVVFGEDHSQVRDSIAAQNGSILREFALKAMRDEPSKRSLLAKRKLATLDPAFRSKLLLALFHT